MARKPAAGKQKDKTVSPDKQEAPKKSNLKSYFQ
jgi:hypothetical protein